MPFVNAIAVRRCGSSHLHLAPRTMEGPLEARSCYSRPARPDTRYEIQDVAPLLGGCDR